MELLEDFPHEFDKTNKASEQGCLTLVFDSTAEFSSVSLARVWKLHLRARQELIQAPWEDSIHLQWSQNPAPKDWACSHILPGILRCWWAAPQSWESDLLQGLHLKNHLAGRTQRFSSAQKSSENQPKLYCDYLWARAHYLTDNKVPVWDGESQNPADFFRGAASAMPLLPLAPSPTWFWITQDQPPPQDQTLTGLAVDNFLNPGAAAGWELMERQNQPALGKAQRRLCQSSVPESSQGILERMKAGIHHLLILNIHLFSSLFSVSSPCRGKYSPKLSESLSASEQTPLEHKQKPQHPLPHPITAVIKMFILLTTE